MSNGKWFTILLLLTGVVILSGVLIRLRIANELNGKITQDRYFYERKQIEILINDLGASNAYSQFSYMLQKQKSETKRHSAAHLFGEVLYKETGMKGLRVCDEAFSYGCFHSFLGEALRDRGLSISKDLDLICSEEGDAIVCQHGIGHGILAYLGYDFEHLNKALELCRELRNLSPTGGCANGVFMEYNRRTMINLAESPDFYRPLINDDYNFPCDSISDHFQAACYYEQVHWWTGLMNRDYKKVGELCGQIENQDMSDLCVESLAYSLPPKYDYDIDEVISTCDMMFSGSQIVICRANAARRYLEREDLVNEYSQLCNGLSPVSKKECLEEAGL